MLDFGDLDFFSYVFIMVCLDRIDNSEFSVSCEKMLSILTFACDIGWLEHVAYAVHSIRIYKHSRMHQR